MDGTLYYCAFSVRDWLPVFVSEQPCQIIAESLSFCHQHKQLGVDSFVIMPAHLHLIVFDREWDSVRLQRTLTDLRKFTGRQLCRFCQEAMPSCVDGALASAASDDREHRFWHPTRHPESIESEKCHNQKRDYLHDNPRRKGLVQHPSHWRWSSARWYETGETCGVTVTPVMWWGRPYGQRGRRGQETCAEPGSSPHRHHAERDEYYPLRTRSSASAMARSDGVVILRFRNGVSTSFTSSPSRSTALASSVTILPCFKTPS